MLKTEIVSHQKYSDGISNTKRMILMTEFILEGYEDLFVEFLKQIDLEKFAEFEYEVNDLIAEFGITDTEINELLKIKLPAS